MVSNALAFEMGMLIGVLEQKVRHCKNCISLFHLFSDEQCWDPTRKMSLDFAFRLLLFQTCVSPV